MQGYSLIIPVFNEAKNLTNLVKEISKSLKKFKYEVIIVDDDSYDNSKKYYLRLKS